MKHIFQLPILLLSFVLFSCQDRNAGSRPYNVRDIDPLSVFPKPEVLIGEIVELDKALHGRVGWSAVHDGQYIVTGETQNINNQKFFLIDLEYKKLYKFLNHGRGPCEFGNTFAFDIDVESRIISLYDNDKMKLIRVNIDSIIANTDSYRYCPDVKDILNTGAKARRFIDLKSIDKNHLIAFHDEFADSMYTVIDLKKGVSRPFLSWPDTPEYEEKYQKQCRMQFGGGVYMADREHIALIAQPAIIDILKFDGNNLKRVKQFEYFRYPFSLKPEGGIKRGYVEKNGFIDGFVTKSFIYAGYDGLSDKEWSKLHKVDGDYRILIHDWEGNPVKALHLDRHLRSFIVLDDDKTIYGFTNDGKGVDLIKYTIN